MNEITDQLARLATPAPDPIEPSVLLEAGLADGIIERDTSAGPLQVAFNPRGISATALTGDRQEFARSFAARFGRRAFSVEAMPNPMARKLDRCLSSGRVGDLPLDFGSVTPFQRTVLRVVASIPPGQVRPYGWVARESGRPNATRAVGTTMARNPIPVVVPCHRVVRSDGHLGNYLYGAPVKAALLKAEGIDVAEAESNAQAGKLLLGSDTTHIVCHPSCHHARRITNAHKVWFRTMAEAGEAGYRACLDCRPAA